MIRRPLVITTRPPLSEYRRILLKISGESLMGPRAYGIDPETVHTYALDIQKLHMQGLEIGLVLGGGNIFRGLKEASAQMDRASADYIGMLATVMNAKAMQSVLLHLGVPAIVMSAIPMGTVCETYDHARALQLIQSGTVVLFAAGSGNPFFTTDTAAALRALEMHCNILLKATKVDGVYDQDPLQFPDAKRYDMLTYDDVLQRRLGVMDMTAISLARENALPVLVCSGRRESPFSGVMAGKYPYTLICKS